MFILQWQNAQGEIVTVHILHEEYPVFNIQAELREKPKRVKLCWPLRLLNMSVMKDLQWIPCCGVTVPCRAARCPIPNWGMMTSRGVSENTSQTRHPQHALETLGTDDMWHAIMQIAKVNVTHFLAYERQFLSLFSEQALSLHNIRRAFPQISCAEPMERQRHRFTSLGMKKKGGKTNRGRHFRAPCMAVGFKWFDTFEN